MESRRYSLDGAWSLFFTLPDTGARYDTEVCVPCNVEPTLVKLGLIDDYLPCDDERACERFEGVDDWCYTRWFDALQMKWAEDGRVSANHFFTQKTNFETTRAWCEIIQKECGLLEVPQELQ